MEEKKEAYEEAKKNIDKALEELSYFKNDKKVLGIWCELLDIEEFMQEEIKEIEEVLENRAKKEYEYQNQEQNRIYREVQGF